MLFRSQRPRNRRDEVKLRYYLRQVLLPDYPVWLLILAGIAFLLLYDFVYTFLIGFYLRRIKGRGIDGMKLS